MQLASRKHRAVKLIIAFIQLIFELLFDETFYVIKAVDSPKHLLVLLLF